ncbi:hypothetical protein C2G38_2147234 [Gigaspora rosea]|uniref:Uncharacterized protein n=1 Tax=Gigaspora rosea TaxID=44941 RepID=A0A397UEP4_9GLOM|nr:hypothetical protein C2G38_2147234 [Gigaspora rosea]
MSNRLIVKQHEKTNYSSDINQITNNFNQLYLKNNNTQDIIGEIVKELYNLYYNERLKGKHSEQLFYILDEFLVKRKQNPNNVIKWCLENPNNFMTQIILATCYRLGKWIEKDENKAFIYYQKSAEMGDASGTCGVGYCYVELKRMNIRHSITIKNLLRWVTLLECAILVAVL